MMKDTMQAGPLSGLQVVDFSELLPGPFFTQNLLELGASVTKVERPPNGDSARVMYPGVFESVNRGKSSIIVDLKTPDGLAQVCSLVEKADVFVEGYRPGVMARLGLGYEAVSAINPAIIYVSISGYGQTGPNSRRPGHDINYLAMAGALALGGSDLATPAAGAGLPVADLAGAMYALSSTLAALYARVHSKQGCYLDVSLTDCVTHWMNPRLGHFRSAGQYTLSAQREEMLNKPAYGVFRTGQGEYLALGALEDHFWKALKEALAITQFEPHDRTYAQRCEIANEINEAISLRIAALSTQQICALLQDENIPASCVERPLEMPESTQVRARHLSETSANGSYIHYPVDMTHVYRS